VNEPSEYISAPNAVEGDDGLWLRRRFFDWRSLAEGAVGAMLVVMTDVDREDSFEVPAVHDHESVEALAAHGADPAFNERVRARCPCRCADRLIPSVRNASSNAAVNLLSRSWIKNRIDRLRPLDERFDDVPCLIPLACARKNCCQVSEARRCAGSMPACCGIDQTALAAIRTPSPASSAWIRR
jgi:hypothetical protein